LSLKIRDCEKVYEHILPIFAGNVQSKKFLCPNVHTLIYQKPNFGIRLPERANKNPHLKSASEPRERVEKKSLLLSSD